MSTKQSTKVVWDFQSKENMKGSISIVICVTSKQQLRKPLNITNSWSIRRQIWFSWIWEQNDTKRSFESAQAIDTWGMKYSCELCDFRATFKHALKIPSLRMHKQMKHLWNYEWTCFKDLSVKESCPIQPLCFQKMFPFQKYLWWIKWSKYHILSYFCISRILCISCIFKFHTFPRRATRLPGCSVVGRGRDLMTSEAAPLCGSSRIRLGAL